MIYYDEMGLTPNIKIYYKKNTLSLQYMSCSQAIYWEFVQHLNIHYPEFRSPYLHL